MVGTRAHCPVVFIAYGPEGGAWLRAIRGRCLAFPATKLLAEHRALQFWWIAGHGATPEGVSAWPTLPVIGEISDALSEARSSELSLLIPGFEQRRVIIVERANVFLDELATLRRELNALLDQVPGSRAMAKRGELFFEYQRVLLADARHNPTVVTNAQRLSAREALSANGEEPCAVFLVDRENTNVAVVSEQLAEQSLTEVAVAFAISDLGAPRRDGAPTELPGSLSAPPASTVIPFGLTVLEHRWRDIDVARTRSFREQLAAAVIAAETSAPPLPRTTLRSIVDEDVSALERGAFDAHERRRRRIEECREFLSWAFSTPNKQTSRDLLSDAKRTADQLMADRSHDPATPRDALALTAPMLIADSLRAAADTTSTGRFAPQPFHFAVAASLLVAAGAVAYRRRRKLLLEPTAMNREAFDAIMDERRALREEWRRLLRTLESLIVAWDRTCQEASHRDSAASATDQTIWEPVPPNRLRLTSALGVSTQAFNNPLSLCNRLATACMHQIDAADGAERVLERAAREATRGLSTSGVDVGITTEYLKAAVDHPDSDRMRTTFAQTPWLLNPTCPVEPEATIWLMHPDLAGSGVFEPLEAAAALRSIMWRSHEDLESSIRLHVGVPIPLNAISSLLDKDI